MPFDDDDDEADHHDHSMANDDDRDYGDHDHVESSARSGGTLSMGGSSSHRSGLCSPQVFIIITTIVIVTVFMAYTQNTYGGFTYR